jgi:DNA-binding protein H-NS
MSKLTALKKQIATLQAQAERIAKTEASSAIAKVKQIMAEFNLTIEHLTQTVTGKHAAKKTKVKAASVAKYADPKTGKTWSGFGRAPGWIAGAKNREAFLVDKSGIKAAEPAVKAPAAAKKASVKKAAVKVAKAVKVATKVAKKAAKPAGKRVKAEATAAAEAAVKTVATKPAAVKKAATKKVAKPKAVAKKAAGRKAKASVAAPAPAESAASAG